MSWTEDYYLNDMYGDEPEPARPRCQACESIHGENEALPAAYAVPGILTPGYTYYCQFHAEERGLITPAGYDSRLIELLDSMGEPLPVCHNCGDIVPELEIYYTIHGLDYCQHCVQARIDAMSEDERDAWLTDPK